MSIFKNIITWIISLFRKTPIDQEVLESRADQLNKDLDAIDDKLEDINADKMSNKDIEDYFNK